MIHIVALSAFDVIGFFSRLLQLLFGNIVLLFILFFFAYYILVKLFNIRGEAN